ncbi:MAG: type I methionyl aminopeptidase [Panacagrimonas sp.]
MYSDNASRSGITYKTPEERVKMRAAGRAAASVLEMIAPQVKAGVSTEELNAICHRFIVDELGCIPAPLNYKGFPRSICTSVNQVVCHGIPGSKVLKRGDLINIDITVIKDGWHGDTSQTFHIGEPTILAKRLVDTTREAMIAGIRAIRPGLRLGDLGSIIQRLAESRGFSVVREYCGHGIGRVFHEEPQVLHYGKPGSGVELQDGMCFTVEPMLNAGRAEVKLMPDGWTVVTKDHSLSAQWEHTVLVTETGYEVLTLREGETV